MKIWHDDVRPAPEGWVWVRTNEEAKIRIRNSEVVEISLDHDYDLVLWMIETGKVPERVTIHSWNPDGAERMARALNDAGFNCVIAPFRFPR